MSVRVHRAVWASFAFACLLTVFVTADDASAYSTYVDVQPVFAYVEGGQSVDGVFDIVNPGSDCFFTLCDQGGFNPGDEVVSAWVGFVFYSVDGATEEAMILLGDPSDPLQTGGFDQQIYVLHLESFNANLEVRTELSETGQLQWTVYAPDGAAPTNYTYSSTDGENDFILKYAKLKAVVDDASIPEPTAALLYAAGLGVIGTRVRRRRQLA